MVKLAKYSGKLPKSMYVDDIRKDGSEYPWAYGSVADIFRGTVGGQAVVIKRLRINARGTERTQMFDVHFKGPFLCTLH